MLLGGALERLFRLLDQLLDLLAALAADLLVETTTIPVADGVAALLPGVTHGHLAIGALTYRLGRSLRCVSRIRHEKPLRPRRWVKGVPLSSSMLDGCPTR